jgi:ABC-type antimicrobial peptide transport system permease subunit
MQDWLSGFVYKTSPGWLAFGGAVVLVVALVSVVISLQVWQAGRRNPVDALREE